MKKIGCVLLVLLLVLMAGCSAGDEWENARQAAIKLQDTVEDPQLRERTLQMLDALIADDFETAYSLVSGIAEETEFRSVYTQLRTPLEQVESYELLASYINKNVNNGVASTAVRYMLTAGEVRLLVEASRVEGYDGLTSLYINTYDPVTITGTLGNMQGADALQWIFLIIGVLELAFVVWMFVDCCRHKLRRKWLWLLFIALGYVLINLIATPEQFRVNFNVGAYLSYTCLIRYSTGGFTAQIVVPLGAILYGALRKSLFAKYAQLQQKKALEAQAKPEEENLQIQEE